MTSCDGVSDCALDPGTSETADWRRAPAPQPKGALGGAH